MSVAPDAGTLDTNDLAQQIFADDTAGAGEQSKVEVPETEDKPQAEEEKPAIDEAKAEESEEEAPEAPEDEEAAKPEDEKKAKGIRIGNQTFASEADAIVEAKRVIGHNANLAGEVRSISRERDELKEKLEEALTANEEWEKFTAQMEKGNVDPVLIAQKAIEAYERNKNKENLTNTLAEQVAEIQKLPKYADVEDVIYQISDKINPLTGKYFTPRESYDFALKWKGISETPEQSKPKVATVPKNLAARATGSAKVSSIPPQTQNKDFVDEALERTFSTL
jgi:hypothetical protein